MNGLTGLKVRDWHSIRETDTLNTAMAKGANDTKHICPLQPPVIRRCVKMFSNPGDIVFRHSPESAAKATKHCWPVGDFMAAKSRMNTSCRR